MVDTAVPAPDETVARINELFKAPEDLEGLQQVVDYTRVARAYLCSEMRARAAPTVAPLASEIPAQIATVRQSWNSLEQATHSTRLQVESMTTEINSLDHTKDNLVSSVTILKRLQMLTKLHSQLQTLLKAKQYRELTHSLPAALELTEYFREFRSLPHVAELSQLVADFRLKVETQVMADLERFCKGDRASLSELPWACRAAENKQQVLDWYCDWALRSYTQVFSIGSEAAGLDNIDRRYAMIRNLVNKHMSELDQAAFPKEWHVGVELAKRACARTQQDIALLQFDSAQSSVQLLLNSLQQSTEFEAYLRRKFPEHAAEFVAPISRSFVPHLNIWVEYHQRTLSDKLQAYQSHDWDEDSGDSDVFSSSVDLFLYYRNAMDQMSKLTTGAPLASLAKVFGDWLARYSKVLAAYVPRKGGAFSSEESEATSKILKTADYCISTTTQLETSIYNLVDEQYKPQIDFSVANDRFFGVIKQCLDAFVMQVHTQLKGPFREMVNANWARIQQVGDQSSYVAALAQQLQHSTAQITQSLAKPAHRRIVCDGVVEQTTLTFLTSVMRIKPVSEVGAEQLLLDIYAIKKTAQELLDDEKYRTSAAAAFAKIENILKVLLTQDDPPEGLVQNYLLLVKDASVANFRKILDAKGLRSQARFIDLFKKMADPALPSNVAPLALVQGYAPAPEARTKSPPPELAKFTENFKRFGDFLRRDNNTPNGSPLLR